MRTEYEVFEYQAPRNIPEVCKNIPHYGLNVFFAPGSDIWYRNIAGEDRGGKFDKAGKRVFSLELHDRNLVDKLSAEGWNIKVSTNENGEERFMLPCEFSGEEYWKQPRVTVVSQGVENTWERSKWGLLDSADIENISLEIVPGYHEPNALSPSVVKAWVSQARVVIAADRFADRFKEENADVPFA